MILQLILRLSKILWIGFLSLTSVFLLSPHFLAIYHFINHIFNKLILFWNTDFSICSYVPTVLGNMWSDPWWWYIRSHKKLKPFEIIAFNRDTVNNLSRLNVRLDCHLPREFEYSWFRGLEITCNFFCDFGDFVIWWYVIRRGGGYNESAGKLETGHDLLKRIIPTGSWLFYWWTNRVVTFFIDKLTGSWLSFWQEKDGIMAFSVALTTWSYDFFWEKKVVHDFFWSSQVTGSLKSIHFPCSPFSKYGLPP